MNEYLVVIEWADGNWSAYAPDVPGCVSTGSTKEECSANFAEALDFHFAGLKEDGLPLPEPKAVAEKIRPAA